MARLPQPGADDGTWGDLLNDYLSVSLDTGGELKTDSVFTNAVQDNAISDAKVASGIAQSKITNLTTDLSAHQAALDSLDTRTDTLESAGIVNLTDASTIATNASAGKLFRVTVTADRTLGIPTSPADGMRRIWEITASGANRNIILPTGSAGSFELTTNITSPITILSGKTHFVGAMYNASRDRWTVLASQATS